MASTGPAETTGQTDATRVVSDPNRRQRYVFRRGGENPAIDPLEIEVWADPGGDVPEHFHPRQEESFEVLAGDVSFKVDRKRTPAKAGDKVTVPAGVRHAFVNDGDSEAHLLVQVRPGLDLQEFLEATAGLGRAGKVTRRNVPRSPSALLEMAVLVRQYGENTVVTRPPLLVQRLLLWPVAALARRRGITAASVVAAAREIP